MTEKLPVKRREFKHYSDDEITRGLMTLAFSRNATEAVELLQEQGVITPDRSTLTRWRERYQNRYVEIVEKHKETIEKVLVVEQRELARAARDGAMEAVELERKRIKVGDVKDAAGSARNLMTTAAIAIDKLMALEGRPTSVVKYLSGEEALRNLAKYGRVIEGTAEEE
jgi:hypothetical protein